MGRRGISLNPAVGEKLHQKKWQLKIRIRNIQPGRHQRQDDREELSGKKRSPIEGKMPNFQSLSRKLEPPGRAEPQRGKCLHQLASRQTCGGAFLINVCCGRPQSTVGIHRQGVPESIRRQTEQAVSSQSVSGAPLLHFLYPGSCPV